MITSAEPRAKAKTTTAHANWRPAWLRSGSADAADRPPTFAIPARNRVFDVPHEPGPVRIAARRGRTRHGHSAYSHGQSLAAAGRPLRFAERAGAVSSSYLGTAIAGGCACQFEYIVIDSGPVLESGPIRCWFGQHVDGVIVSTLARRQQGAQGVRGYRAIGGRWASRFWGAVVNGVSDERGPSRGRAADGGKQRKVKEDCKGALE